MSDRILTLFGEELKPEQPNVPGKNRSRKKLEDKKENTDQTFSPQEPESTVSLFAPVVTELPLAATTLQAEDINSARDTNFHESNPKETELKIEPERAELANEDEIIYSLDASTEISVGKPAKKKKEPKEKTGDKPNLPADWNGEKQYYTIGEVADLFKVNTSHIRFWTNEFNLKVRTTRKGDRLYTPAQIKEIRAIHHLVKERGFTLAGAKAKLKQHANTEIEAVGLKQSLIMLRGKLLAIRTQLK